MKGYSGKTRKSNQDRYVTAEVFCRFGAKNLQVSYSTCCCKYVSTKQLKINSPRLAYLQIFAFDYLHWIIRIFEEKTYLATKCIKDPSITNYKLRIENGNGELSHNSRWIFLVCPPVRYASAITEHVSLHSISFCNNIACASGGGGGGGCK